MNKNYINYSDLPEEIQFEDEFKDIFYKMEHSKENMFVTGKAGSGKTTLLEYFRINSSKNFIILPLLTSSYLISYSSLGIITSPPII